MFRVTQINASAGIGGGERHLLLLARYLHGADFHFDFILPEEGALCDQLRRLDVSYAIVPMKTKFQAQAWRQMHRLLQANRTDLAHCHGARGNWYGRTAARLAGTRVIFSTVHNSLKDYPYPAWRRRLYVELEKCTAGLVRQWIAVSEAIRRDLVEYYRLPAARIAVVPNGIDANDLTLRRSREQVRHDLGLEPDSCVLLEAARMTEQKGHRFLLEAVALLRGRIPGLHCLLAGDGPTRPLLQREAQRLRLAGCVHFLGFRTDIADLINASDIYVLPSLSEGMPMGLLEAMALGCAVVASSVNGVPEVVRDRIEGLLVAPADAAALAGGLKKLARDPGLRRRLGSAARQAVREHFTAERMAHRVGELYRLHLGARGCLGSP